MYYSTKTQTFSRTTHQSFLTANSTGFVCYIRIENPAKNDPDPLPQGMKMRGMELQILQRMISESRDCR